MDPVVLVASLDSLDLQGQLVNQGHLVKEVNLVLLDQLDHLAQGDHVEKQVPLAVQEHKAQGENQVSKGRVDNLDLQAHLVLLDNVENLVSVVNPVREVNQELQEHPEHQDVMVSSAYFLHLKMFSCNIIFLINIFLRFHCK